MNALVSNYDVIFAGIVLVSVIMALIRGGVVELLSLGVWVLAFIVMRNYGDAIAVHLPHSISNEFIRSATVFVIIFVVLAIAMALVKKLCRGIIKSSGLLGLDSLLGILFGAIRGILFCAILVILVAMLRLDPHNAWQESRFYPVIAPVINWVVGSIPQGHKITVPLTNNI